MVAAAGCYNIALLGTDFLLDFVVRNFLWSFEYPR
jgi:hypothetical protein